MLPKSLEQADALTSQAGGMEKQSQGDLCVQRNGACIITAFLTILIPFFGLAVSVIEPRASCVLGKH